VEDRQQHDEGEKNSEHKRLFIETRRGRDDGPSDNSGNLLFRTRTDESVNGALTLTLRQNIRSDLSAKYTVRALADQYEFRENGTSGEQFVVSDVYRGENTTSPM
jgi:hypothetical protein